MPLDKGWWLEVESGDSVSVREHFDEVRANPFHYGVEQSGLSTDRAEVLTKVLRNGWIRVQSYGRETIFEYDSPSSEKAVEAIAEFIQSNGLAENHWIRINDFRLRKTINSSAESVLAAVEEQDALKLFNSPDRVEHRRGTWWVAPGNPDKLNPLMESSFAKVIQHMSLKAGFGILAASKHDHSPEVNDQRTKDLKKDIKDLGYSFIDGIRGFYKETWDIPPQEEPSIFVPSMTDEETRELAAKYDQDSYIWGEEYNWKLKSVDDGEEWDRGHGFSYIELESPEEEKPSTHSFVKGKDFSLKGVAEPEIASAHIEDIVPGDVVCVTERFGRHSVYFVEVARSVNEATEAGHAHGIEVVDTVPSAELRVKGRAIALNSKFFSASRHHFEVGTPSGLGSAVGALLSI
jgi:hypothetical protein